MENKPSFITIPGAIIIAGAIIAITLIYVFKPASTVTKDAKVENAPSINLAPITSADHILGNPNAPIKIVEYSDPSCPFCKSFNETMVEITNKYGPEGKVAWIYRSLPLDTPDANGNVLHPNAANESRAMECAAILGGNDKFWEYERQLYTLTPSVTSQNPKGLDQKQLPIIAKGLGLDVVAFNECLTSQKAKDSVDTQKLSGVNASVSGTPTSFFVLSEKINPTATTYVSNALIQYRIPQDLLYVTDDKKMIVMSGAMPKVMISGIIDSLLK